MRPPFRFRRRSLLVPLVVLSIAFLVSALVADSP
jgi:hypothetical protein